MKRSRHHGVFLLDIFAALVIASTAIVLAAYLTGDLFQRLRDTPKQDWQAGATQTMLTAIRRDVWSAASMQLTSPQSVKLVSPDGGAVVWSVDDIGTVTRTDADTRNFTAIAKGLTFQVDGPSLVLNWPVGNVSESIRCVSQLQLAQVGAR